MNKIERRYWRRVQKFDRTLDRQKIGADSSMKGFDFQEMVSIIEILGLASEVLDARAQGRPEESISLEQNSYDAVDDLFILRPGRRRHLQIKSSEDPSWEARLVSAFWSDYFRYKDGHDHLQLDLIVSSIEARDKMRRNMGTHNLGLINVKVEMSTAHLPSPYRNSSVQLLLNRVKLGKWHALRAQSMWSDILGGWREAGRKGSIYAVFAVISKVSGGTITSLSRRSTIVEEMLSALRGKIPELRFAADGTTLVAQYRHGSLILPPSSWTKLTRKGPSGLPSTLQEFEEVLGLLRRARPERKS